MSTPIIAASAAAFGLYVYLKQRQQSATAEGSALRTSPVTAEAWRHVEHPPNTWTEALYYVKEVCRYMYTETLGRWHTVDLFVGLAYLSHREPLEYPAMDIAYRGRLLSQDQSLEATQALLVELKEVQRHLLYCRGLKYFKEDQQIRFWVEHLQLDPAQVLSQSAKAKVLRPAYVLLADTELRCIVLCIRGTQNYQDLFTSLAATSKPHHKVSANGVVLGFSHLGMLTAARWLLRELARDICLAMKMHPGYKLRVVGHSMGAGTAALLTTMLREGIPECADAKCYALACPACMTLELAQSCKDYVTSIVHGTDIVPTFSAASVDALREDVMHSSWFVEFQRDLRTSLYRTVQDGWRGMGSATQWTARNILQPPFRSCYPQGQTAGSLSAAGTVPPSARNPSLAADILASAAGAEAVSTSGSEQDLSASGILRHHSHNAEWPQARQTRRSSGSGAPVGNGDTWLPANHMGGALSAQQLRRRLWPWGTGRERDGGSGDNENIGVSYEAAASMSYAGWLPDSEHYNPPVGAAEQGGRGEQAAGRTHQQRASSDGGGSGGAGGAVRATGVVGGVGANGQYFDAYEESPSKRKSWSALQGLSKWWQQRLSTAGGSGTTTAVNAGVAPGGAVGSKPGAEGLARRPSEALHSAGAGVLESGSEQVSRAAGAGLASAGPQMPAAPPGGSSAAWLLRGMFNVCTTRRAHAQNRPLATSDSARLDELDGEQLSSAGPSLTMSSGLQDIGVSEGLGGELGADDEMPGAGDEFEAREVQEDITAVVAAMAGEGADAEGLREGHEEDEEDGDLAANLTAEEQEALLRELGEGAMSPIAAGSPPTSPVRVGRGRPSLPSGNGLARKAQRLSGPGGPGQRAAAAGAQEDSSSTAGPQSQAVEHLAGSTGHEAELQHDGFGLAAPKRHMYPPGRILHLLPAARISGPTGPLPSSSPAPRSQLGAPPLGGVSAAMLADSISRNTPTPSGIRPGTAEITSSRVAFYESPHVMLEVPDNQAYSRIKLCRTMVLDHLMPAYLTALGSVVQQLEAQVQQHAVPSMPMPASTAAPLLARAAPPAAGASTSGSASALAGEQPSLNAPLRGLADSRATPEQPSNSQASTAPSLPPLPPPLPPSPRASTAADKKELSQAVQDVAAARRQASAPAVAEPVLLGPSLSAGTVHLRNTARQRPIFSADGDLL